MVIDDFFVGMTQYNDIFDVRCMHVTSLFFQLVILYAISFIMLHIND